MNLSNLNIKSISRIIAHTIHPKSPTEDAYSSHTNQLLRFSDNENALLIKRLETALSNSKKAFKVDYDDLSDTSIHKKLHTSHPFSDDLFVEHSQTLSDKLADAHFRTTIPGGYCLIGEGMTSQGKYFFFIIKAELQEVFSIEDDDLKRVENVFLSPAKEFYKIGFFIRDSEKFIPFMYDDQFAPQKKDLTEYFYSQFLGLRTDRNDRILSKNFFNDTQDFIRTAFSDNHQDMLGMLKSLTVYYRENVSGLVSARDFSETYFEGKHKADYDEQVSRKYPHSFTKDISLIENKMKLQRVSISLSSSMAIVGDANSLGNVEVVESPTQETLDKLTPEINSGSVRKMVVLREKSTTLESILEGHIETVQEAALTE